MFEVARATKSHVERACRGEKRQSKWREVKKRRRYAHQPPHAPTTSRRPPVKGKEEAHARGASLGVTHWTGTSIRYLAHIRVGKRQNKPPARGCVTLKHISPRQPLVDRTASRTVCMWCLLQEHRTVSPKLSRADGSTTLSSQGW